jgi:hypothetical protein
MSANRKYKSSVFSCLLSDEARLREVYGALAGIDVPPDEPVTINTLSDVLFMEQINDVSFTIGDRLVVLIEHQSTINPNMPLRLLMYIARVYEKIIPRNTVYKSDMIQIPRPEFYVLYNGVDPYEDKSLLKLSDMFAEIAPELRLELTVPVYNINEGHNPEILKKSATLDGYSVFIEKVREYYNEAGDLKAALKNAKKWCGEHGVLVEFLKEHGTEVDNMLITEWNTDEAKKVWREEGIQKGIGIGRQEGIGIGIQKGIGIGRQDILDLLRSGKSVDEVLRTYK